MIGIYLIAHDSSKKVYIGSTTLSFKRRFIAHRSRLRTNTHDNPGLQATVNKYGMGGLSFNILEIVDDLSNIYGREQYWLDFYNKFGETFNCGKVAKNPMIGHAHSKEFKKYLSNINSGEGNPNYGRVWSKQVRKRMSISAKNRKPRIWTKEARKNLGNAMAKEYPAFINRVTGEIIPSGNNLRKLCQKKNLNYPRMIDVKNNKRKSHADWILFKEEKK